MWNITHLKISKFPSIFDECHRIDLIGNLVIEEVTNQVSSDLLEHCVLYSGTTKDENSKVEMHPQFLEASP